jgi:quercetin dioxygenase-like cupin family protein
MAQPLFDPARTNAARLAEICPVVPGAIVSKPLLNEPYLRQVVFAMDAGQEMSEHRAPFLAVVQMIDGRIDFTVDAVTHTLEAGDWLSMPPDKPHALLAHTPSRFMLTLARSSEAEGGT